MSDSEDGGDDNQFQLLKGAGKQEAGYGGTGVVRLVGITTKLNLNLSKIH